MPSSTVQQREQLQARRAAAATAAGSTSIVTTLVTTPASPTSYNRTNFRVNLKTSITHPINVSWIIPEELVAGLARDPLPMSLDLFDVFTSAPMYGQRANTANQQQRNDNSNATPQNEDNLLLGNLALSSCPGKKVRLTGPVRGRATINRDLELDFQRLKSLGISAIVCCLNDDELRFLGAPWSHYSEIARKYNLDVIRIPMIEGGCPESLEQIDDVVTRLNQYVENGQKVLAHCRGGVGRAGLVACCWLLKRRFCRNGERSIQLVRMRRSPKAIETMQQVEFIMQYARYVHRRQQQQQQQREVIDTNTAVNPIATATPS